jgi:hypothetical protein
MDVAGRVEKLRREASKLDGILEIDINHILDTVTIKYNPGRTSLDRIRKTIEK